MEKKRHVSLVGWAAGQTWVTVAKVSDEGARCALKVVAKMHEALRDEHHLCAHGRMESR